MLDHRAEWIAARRQAAADQSEATQVRAQGEHAATLFESAANMFFALQLHGGNDFLFREMHHGRGIEHAPGKIQPGAPHEIFLPFAVGNLLG